MAPAAADRPRRVGFVPEIALGSVVSILTIIASVVGVTMYAGDAKGDIGVNSQRITAIEVDRVRARLDYQRDQDEMRRQMVEMNRKLDTLLLMNSRGPRVAPADER